MARKPITVAPPVVENLSTGKLLNTISFSDGYVRVLVDGGYYVVNTVL